MARAAQTAQTTETTAADKAGSISEQASAALPVRVEVGGMGNVGPVDLSKLKAKKILTMPLLQCSRAGQQVLVEMLGTFFTGKKVDEKKDAATLVEVRNLADGLKYHFIVAAVVKRELEDQFADGSYVGKWFAIEAGDKKEMKGGNSFRNYRIVELEKVG